MDHVGYVTAAYAIALGTPGAMLALALRRISAARALERDKTDESNR